MSELQGAVLLTPDVRQAVKVLIDGLLTAVEGTGGDPAAQAALVANYRAETDALADAVVAGQVALPDEPET